MREIVAKIPYFLCIFIFFLLTYLIIPLDTIPEMALLVFIIVIAFDKLPRNLREVFKCVKKYRRPGFIAVFIMEAMLFLFVIYGTYFLLGIKLMPYVALFWLTSALMRMCFEVTPLVFEERMQKTIEFYQDFGIIRLAYFILPGLYFRFEGLIYLLAILIFILVFSFFSLPIISFVLEPKKLKMRIKISRSLFPDNKRSIEELSNLKGLNKKEVAGLLHQLKRENLVEFIEGKYQLSERVKRNLHF